MFPEARRDDVLTRGSSRECPCKASEALQGLLDAVSVSACETSEARAYPTSTGLRVFDDDDDDDDDDDPEVSAREGTED